MSSQIRRVYSSVVSINISQQYVVLGLIALLIGILLFTTSGGSISQNVNDTFAEVEDFGNPSETDIGDNNFDLNNTNFPSVNPPANVLEDLQGIQGGLPTTGLPNTTRTGGGGGSGGGLPTIPTNPNNPVPSNPIDVPTLPTDTLNPGDGGPIQGDDPNSDVSRPNKARNLLNLSEYAIFPEIRTSFFSTFQDRLDPTVFNMLFMLVLAGSIYFPIFGFAYFLRQLREYDEDEESIFFKPIITEEQIKREEERQRRLLTFDTFVNNLIEETRLKLDEINYQETIIEVYHKFDQGLQNFSKLKRTKDLTPFEHSQLKFETQEIHNENLENIVELFYKARFGHKDMTKEDLKTLINNLTELVNKEAIEERAARIRSWRLMR